MKPSAARVAHRFLHAALTPVRITGGDRESYIDDVWRMYEGIYRTIGMSVKTARGLLEYPVWDLVLHDGRPVAFSLYKQKKYGLKSGLSGHDGSSEGKSAALQSLRSKYKRPGVYGEVSHKVKAIALSAGAPVVCAAYASQVLGKPTDIDEDDPLQYSRVLKGVGKVTKTLVGNPRGIPTTDPKNPSCPLVQTEVEPTFTPGVTPAQPERSRLAAEEELEDLDAHYAMMALTASLKL